MERRPIPLTDNAVAAIISIPIREAFSSSSPWPLLSPGSIQPVIPTAEAAEAAGASLRDLAGFRASHGLRQASLCLDL